VHDRLGAAARLCFVEQPQRSHLVRAEPHPAPCALLAPVQPRIGSALNFFGEAFNFAQNPSLDEITIPHQRAPFQGGSVPRHVGANGDGSCMNHSAIAIRRQNVCGPLNKRAIPFTAPLISRWLHPGSRSPVRMRQRGGPVLEGFRAHP
jgi:hypothetical protein